MVTVRDGTLWNFPCPHYPNNWWWVLFFVSSSGGGLIKVGIPALNVGSIIYLMGFLVWDYRCAPGHRDNGVLEINPITSHWQVSHKWMIFSIVGRFNFCCKLNVCKHRSFSGVSVPCHCSAGSQDHPRCFIVKSLQQGRITDRANPTSFPLSKFHFTCSQQWTL